MPAKFLTLEARTIHVLHTGPTTLPDVPPTLDRGQLYLLVHGAGRNAGDWQRQLDGLGREHSVLAVDLPGHGRSPDLDGLDTVEAYADVLDSLFARLGLRPGVLVGWALGASVAILLAARRPDRFSGLVLIAAGIRCDPAAETIAAVHDVVRGRRPQIFDTSMFSPSTAMDVMREVWTEQVKTDPRVLYTDLLAGRAFDATPHLAALGLPTLVVAGADDRLTPRESSEALARAIPGARLEVIEGAGHVPQREQPGRLNALLVELARGLPS